MSIGQSWINLFYSNVHVKIEYNPHRSDLLTWVLKYTVCLFAIRWSSTALPQENSHRYEGREEEMGDAKVPATQVRCEADQRGQGWCPLHCFKMFYCSLPGHQVQVLCNWVVFIGYKMEQNGFKQRGCLNLLNKRHTFLFSVTKLM